MNYENALRIIKDAQKRLPHGFVGCCPGNVSGVTGPTGPTGATGGLVKSSNMNNYVFKLCSPLIYQKNNLLWLFNFLLFP